VDGQELFYFDEGPGSLGTIVLLHGFPDTPLSFAKVALDLARRGYRVLRPYLPGYAPSQWSGPFDVATVSMRIANFVQTLEVGPVEIVGHDWGAILTYAVLHRRPDLFRAAVAISVPHPRFLLHPKQITLGAVRRCAYIGLFQVPRLPEALARSPRTQLARRLWKRWSPSYQASAEEMAAIEECMVNSQEAPFAYYRNLATSLLARPDNFGDIEVPLMYLHGDEDGCIDPRFARGQERYFRSAYEVEVIPGAGHFLQVEEPALLAQRIVSWFQGPY
jgi:pimeloyl-ACP methyl ester carboxylesterase